MRCPHCDVDFSATMHSFQLGEDMDGTWQVATVRCPACDRIIAMLTNAAGASYPIWPQGSLRPRLPLEVPPEYAQEYHTACQLLAFSTEASAAISRRLLHRFLATHTLAGPGSLDDQVRKAVSLPDLPPYIKQALQTLARIAKLAPQSKKSVQPEALTATEPGEAEWLLDVLEALFNFYFVQPARVERKRRELEKRLEDEQRQIASDSSANPDSAAHERPGEENSPV